MKKMIIFDPAMCCETGVCGPGVDPELLRMASALNNLKNKGIEVERHNLTSNPQAFVDNKMINEILNDEGVDVLPVIIVDDKVMMKKRYPTNKELSILLDVPQEYIEGPKGMFGDCGCSDGCC